MSKIERRIDQKRAAWIDDNKYDVHLMVMNNGFQASGCLIGDLETAKAAYHVLGEWIKTKEAEDEG